MQPLQRHSGGMFFCLPLINTVYVKLSSFIWFVKVIESYCLGYNLLQEGAKFRIMALQQYNFSYITCYHSAFEISFS